MLYAFSLRKVVRGDCRKAKMKSEGIASEDSMEDPAGIMKGKTGKPDTLIQEVILCDSGEEIIDEDEDLILIENTENDKNKVESSSKGKDSLEHSLLRGLLPKESDARYPTLLKMPVVKRCCIEHCYFARNRSKNYRYNLRRFATGEINTLQFENDKELEQQTIDFECLAPAQKVSSVFKNESNVFNDNKVKNKSISSESSISGRSCRSDTEESFVDDLNDRDYCPEDNSAFTDSDNASVESCDSKKQIWRKIESNLSCLKNEIGSEEQKRNISRHRLGITNYPTTNRIPNNFVSIHDILAKIRNMQKLMKGKCDKKVVGESGKATKIPPPKLRKIINRGKGSEFPKISQYLFPMPNLTKMVPGEKNWRVEYMDDVQSLGLDDLLLKASELNAENFTKALGRKLGSAKANMNAKQSSEIVFTIPKAKGCSVEGGQGCEVMDAETSKLSNLKTIKLDSSKPFFGDDEVKEGEAGAGAGGGGGGGGKATSPKRPGIKVKTVENINEEFKDSLSLKSKSFPCSSAGVDNDIFARKSLPCSNNFNGSSVKDCLMLENTKVGEGGSAELEGESPEEGRPFIMTIIQSKTEKQRPAILRNSYLKKKKNTLLESGKNADKVKEMTKESNVEAEQPSGVEDKSEEAANASDVKRSDILSLGSPFEKNVKNASSAKVVYEAEEPDSYENRFSIKRRNIPFILNHSRKCRQAELPPQRNLLIGDTNKGQPVSSKLVKFNEGSEKGSPSEKVFKVTSIEQKLGPKEAANRRFIKVVPYEPANKAGAKKVEPPKEDLQQKHSEEDEDKISPKDGKGSPLISLSAFSTILKEILPEKWFLCLDKRYGIQIIKTQVDELLNPSIMISVVIARCGKLTVNVRGKQLDKSHDLFSNLCQMGNSENKLSLNYVLAILNKLRYLSVCCGCDDPSLKKYWCEEGVIEHHSGCQQVYRSHVCELLVSLGKRRCYPCYRMNETLKKRFRRDNLEEKIRNDSAKSIEDIAEEVEESEQSCNNNLRQRGVKRNLEEFLEKSFSTMKQQISDEIEKNKKKGEREEALRAQEEVLSFMGLTRKVSVESPVRKSKRKKKTFFKLQQPVKKKVDQQELEFLEKYWSDINTLFSTSLLFGAYSRTGRGRLREKCQMFQKLLSTWKDIVKSNPDWIGGDINLPEVLSDEDPLGKDFCADQFEKMEAPALRAYIINSVKEVNRIKHKLRTRNSYFKVLYNKFVKRRMKRPKPLTTSSDQKGTTSSANSATNTPTPTDMSSDESSRDKDKASDNENKAGAASE